MPNNKLGDAPVLGAHQILIKYAGYLGHKQNLEGGLCSGFASQCFKAIFADDVDHFNQRNKLMIDLYNQGKEKAKHSAGSNDDDDNNDKGAGEDENEKIKENILTEISNVKKLITNKSPLNDNQQHISEIPALFEGIVLHQTTVYFRDLFTSKVKGQDFEKVAAITMPKKIDNKEIVSSQLFVGSYEYTDVIDYLTSIQNTVDKIGIKENVVLRITSGNHTMGVSYKQGQWLFMNANFDLDSNAIIECDSVSELAKRIIHGYGLGKHINFATEVICAQEKENNENSAEKILATWRETPEWQRLHRPQNHTNFSRKDVTGKNLYNLACFYRDAEFLKLYLPSIKNLSQTQLNQLLDNSFSGHINKEAVNLLLQFNPDFALMIPGQIPFYLSPLIGDMNDLIPLLDNGFDINIRDENGRSILHYATGINNPVDQIKFLLEHGADINATDSSGITPLQYAINAKNVAMVEYLLKNNADPNLSTQSNASPLFTAVITRDYALLQERLKSDDPNEKRKYNLMTPLHAAAETIYERNIDDILQLLINNKADINAKDRLGRTPLMIACQSCKCDDYFKIGMIDFLLKNGADPTLKDNAGECPASFVAYNNETSHLTNVIGRYQKRDAIRDFLFKDAIDSDNVAHFVKIMELYHCDSTILNQRNCDGQTALHLACSQGNIDAVMALLDKPDTDWSIKDNQGRTAFESAMIDQRCNITFLEQLFERICHMPHQKPLLRVAAEINNMDAFILLLNQGMNFDAEVTEKDNVKAGYTTLHYLSENNQLQFLYELFGSDLDLPQSIDENNMTPIDYIRKQLAENPQNENICAMLKHDENKNTDMRAAIGILIFDNKARHRFVNDPPLSENNNDFLSSVALEHIAIFDDFLKYYLRMPNVDVNAKDETGNTLFSYALNSVYHVNRSYMPEIIQLLLDHSADPDLTKNINRVNPVNVELMNALETRPTNRMKEASFATTKGTGMFVNEDTKKAETGPNVALESQEMKDTTTLLKKS